MVEGAGEEPEPAVGTTHPDAVAPESVTEQTDEQRPTGESHSQSSDEGGEAGAVQTSSDSAGRRTDDSGQARSGLDAGSEETRMDEEERAGSPRETDDVGGDGHPGYLEATEKDDRGRTERWAELTAAVAQAVQQETEDIKGKNLPDGSGDDFRELPPLSCPGVDPTAGRRRRPLPPPGPPRAPSRRRRARGTARRRPRPRPRTSARNPRA